MSHDWCISRGGMVGCQIILFKNIIEFENISVYIKSNILSKDQKTIFKINIEKQEIHVVSISDKKYESLFYL